MSSSPQGRPAPGRPPVSLPEPSVIPTNGWHCGHYFYRFCRERINGKLTGKMCEQLVNALHPSTEASPERLAAYWTSGHRADFCVMVMDPDPAKVDGIHQAIMAPGLGAFIEPTWSFVSMSEVSEYVPTIERFRERLIADGADPASPEVEAKVAAYERRLPMMNEQRLRPEIPDWPAACFIQ